MMHRSKTRINKVLLDFYSRSRMKKTSIWNKMKYHTTHQASVASNAYPYSLLMTYARHHVVDNGYIRADAMKLRSSSNVKETGRYSISRKQRKQNLKFVTVLTVDLRSQCSQKSKVMNFST